MLPLTHEQAIDQLRKVEQLWVPDEMEDWPLEGIEQFITRTKDYQMFQVLLDELRDELFREVVQSVLKQSNSDGLIAYGGLAASERLARRVAARLGVPIELKRPVARMR